VLAGEDKTYSLRLSKNWVGGLGTVVGKACQSQTTVGGGWGKTPGGPTLEKAERRGYWEGNYWVEGRRKSGAGQKIKGEMGEKNCKGTKKGFRRRGLGKR